MSKLDLIPIESSTNKDVIQEPDFRYPSWLEEEEGGLKEDYYVDAKGHLTIGVGHLVAKKGQDFEKAKKDFETKTGYNPTQQSEKKDSVLRGLFDTDKSEHKDTLTKATPNMSRTQREYLYDIVWNTGTGSGEFDKAKKAIENDDYESLSKYLSGSSIPYYTKKKLGGVARRRKKLNEQITKEQLADTKKLQESLNKQGYNLEVDGDKGGKNSNTTKALKDFQEKNDIKPTGTLNKETKSKLDLSLIKNLIMPTAEAAEGQDRTAQLDLQPTGLDLQPVKLELEPKKTTLKLTPKTLDLQPAFYLRGNSEEFTKAYNKRDRPKQVSMFSRVLDIIGRPGQAVKAIINERLNIGEKVLKDMGMTPEEWKNLPTTSNIQEYWKKKKELEKRLTKAQYGKEGLKKQLEGAWEGLSGQERYTANQIWEREGVKGVPLLGFATEIAADPLMWFGGAGYKAITKGVGAVAKPVLKVSQKGLGLGVKGLERLPAIGQHITKAKETIPSITAGLKKAFVDKSGIKGLSELIDKHLLKREYLKGKELRYGVKVRNVIQNISKKTGQSIDDVEKQIVNIIEQPALGAKALPEIRTLSNTLRSHFENIITSEMKAGVPITHLSEGTRGIQYFPRITTKEAKQYLSQAKVGNATIWNTKLSNSLKRKTGDFTLNEFNDFVKANGLESLGGKSVEQFFMRNPAYATATRGVRSAKAVTSAQFLDDVGKTFGMGADEAAQKGYSFYQKLPDTITKLNPSLKGKVFDPELYSEISKVVPKYFNPNELAPLTKVFDGIQNTWKRWTLAPFPKYHIRNMAGNLWNNHLADVNPENYPKAQAIQTYRKYKTASKGIKGNLKGLAERELKGLGITTQQADDIIRQAEQTGVLGHGWFGGDIETTIEKTMQQGFTKLPLNTKIKKVLTGELGIEKGMAFGSTIENNARLAHFIDKIDKTGALKTGLSISDDVAMKSAQSVKKYLFDYGDLTSFEKQIMKRLFPFYTWTRKNIPLQLETLWKKPQKYAPLGIPLRDRNPEDLVKLKYARPDLYERLPVELRRDADTVTYVPLEGLVPAGDIAKALRPDELLFEMLTPYLKTPLELKMNKSMFFESEIQRYDKATQELLKMDIPIKWKYAATTILPQARLLNELNKITLKKERKEELTPLEQAFSQSLSSIYKVSLKDLDIRAKQNLKRKIDDLVRGAKWAKRKKREKEYLRIKETIDETMEIFKELK